MNRNFIFLAIGLLFGVGTGYMLATSNNAELQGHDHTNPADHNMALAQNSAVDLQHTSSHAVLLELNDTASAPSLELEVRADLHSGWNAQLIIQNFAFSPEKTNQKVKAGEGHAHLYINGKKLARVYGKWFHIPNLPKGNHKIRATLNANNHQTLAIDGKPIEATATIRVD